MCLSLTLSFAHFVVVVVVLEMIFIRNNIFRFDESLEER